MDLSPGMRSLTRAVSVIPTATTPTTTNIAISIQSVVRGFAGSPSPKPTVRRIPSGVSSNIQETTIATGKPRIRSDSTTVSNQAGSINAFSSDAATWSRIQLATK